MDKSTITATRYHDFCAGHRVFGHESKCAHLHGHNYRVYFTVQAEALDKVGRVMDFSVIKERLCVWLEKTWDHKMLIWEDDPILPAMRRMDPLGVVDVPFNPTAENMADFILKIVGPVQLYHTSVKLVAVTIEETRKCSATAQF